MSSASNYLMAITLSALACGKQPPAELPQNQPSAPVAIGVGDWVLVSLGTQTMPADSTKRPTLRLDTATLRASGFAGCNRYSGTFTARGASLTFGPFASTRMFCEATSALESAFLAALSATTTYQLSESTLTLRTRDGVEVRFKPAPR